MRHLTDRQAEDALSRGREVEQLLSLGSLPDGRRTVRWVTIVPGRHYVSVAVHHVEDVGDGDQFDVSEFPPLDEDEFVGEGASIGTAETPQAALLLAARAGAATGRWVNSGMVGEEYADARWPRT